VYLHTVHEKRTANILPFSSLIAKHQSSSSDCSLTKSIKVSAEELIGQN
jgi:hypothetical protein